jgi:hypothetical protein
VLGSRMSSGPSPRVGSAVLRPSRNLKGGASFAGITLLQDVKFTAAFTPAIEVGWLLPGEHRGNGYATEGGRTALDYALTTLESWTKSLRSRPQATFRHNA